MPNNLHFLKVSEVIVTVEAIGNWRFFLQSLQHQELFLPEYFDLTMNALGQS